MKAVPSKLYLADLNAFDTPVDISRHNIDMAARKILQLSSNQVSTKNKLKMCLHEAKIQNALAGKSIKVKVCMGRQCQCILYRICVIQNIVNSQSYPQSFFV